jgi:hypothetical protein
VEGWVPQNYLKEEIPAVTIAPPAPPPAPALRPAPAAAGRISPAINKPTINNLAKGPTIPSAPKPPAANGTISFQYSLTIGGVRTAPKPQVANTTTGRKAPPPAPSTRPSGNRTTAAKPPPPPAPPAKQAAAGARPNLAANLADMVQPSLECANV